MTTSWKEKIETKREEYHKLYAEYIPLKEDLLVVGELLENVEYADIHMDSLVEIGKEMMEDVDYLDKKMFVIEQIIEVYERYQEMESMPMH